MRTRHRDSRHALGAVIGAWAALGVLTVLVTAGPAFAVGKLALAAIDAVNPGAPPGTAALVEVER